MIKAAFKASSPILASAGLYGVGSNTLGTALMIIMALAVIANQLWALGEKVRKSVRNPEANTSNLVSQDKCGQYRREIGRTLDSLKADDTRQDDRNKEQVDRLEKSFDSLKKEIRDDIHGLHKSNEDVLKAVSRLEGKVIL